MAEQVMTLTLNGELQEFVREETRRGAFSTPGDFVREIIREWYVQARDRAARLESLDAALAKGLADADAGRVVPLDEAFERLKAELELPDLPSSR